MKQVTQFTKDAWRSGDYTDDTRPVMRATIEKFSMKRVPYRIGYGQTTTWAHDGKLQNALFNQRGPVRELRNLKSIGWQRGVDTDVGTCKIVLYNISVRQDQASPSPFDFDYPGYYTPNRGEGDFFDRWNYESTEWKDWLLPDRMIRTYEGYGTDYNFDPAEDVHLYPSGVWMIDDVTIGADGLITLDCRDVGRLLLDQIAFPPIVPFDIYPIAWEPSKLAPHPDTYDPSGPWKSVTHDKNSNEIYVGQGYTDGSKPAVGPTGGAHGHYGAHAADANVNTHWLSVGSEDPGGSEFIQFNVPGGDDVAGLLVSVRGGPYQVFVSVFANGKWRGVAKIPFRRNDDQIAMPGANLPYVENYWVNKADTRSIKLPRIYHGVTKIRLTFQSHWDSGVGQKRHYRSAVKGFKYASAITKHAGVGQVVQGNYDDYTDVVKWLCAWAGFFWPEDARDNRPSVPHPTRPAHHAPGNDTILPKGNVWGDFRQTQTKGIVPLTADTFDKKPLMDGIAAVRDIVGFDFWVDEFGGVVWRLPNVWRRGCYLAPANGGTASVHQNKVIVIDEKQTLIELSVKLSSKNVRERIFVSDAAGNYGAVVRGYNPAPSGLIRVAGWTDQHFKDRHECRKMADLIAIRQAYLYRQNQVTIAANPQLQIDDQVVIYERLTGEGYLHRVTSIASSYDVEDGQWTYQLTTQWLGDRAFTKRAYQPKLLSQVTRQYLYNLGALTNPNGTDNGGQEGQGPADDEEVETIYPFDPPEIEGPR